MTRTDKSAGGGEPVASHTSAVDDLLDLLARRHVREQAGTKAASESTEASTATGKRRSKPCSKGVET